MLAEAVVLSMKTAPFADAIEGALGAERDVAQIVVVADAAEHEILRPWRRRRASGAVLPPYSLTQASALAPLRL